jgi:hypothetical protein
MDAKEPLLPASSSAFVCVRHMTDQMERHSQGLIHHHEMVIAVLFQQKQNSV